MFSAFYVFYGSGFLSQQLNGKGAKVRGHVLSCYVFVAFIIPGMLSGTQ